MPDTRLRLMVGAVFAAWFWGIYGAANWWTGTLGPLPDSQIALDAAIPFRPGWAWVYLTVTPMLLLPLFVLSQRSVLALAFTLAAEVLVAGICFLIWPLAPSAHPPGPVPSVFAVADAVNLTYNSAPSLHIALSVTCAVAMMRWHRPLMAAGLSIWAAGIVLATLLTHQHYLIDVFTGLILAGAGISIYPAISRRVKNAAISRRISGI